MILFVGEEDRGYFVKETAALRKEPLRFLESNPRISSQIDRILEYTCEYVIFDIEQYVDAAKELAEEIQRITRAKNCDAIIYAPGYEEQSRIIQELKNSGIRYYVFSGNPGEAKEELERCLRGYYKEIPADEGQETQKEEKRKGIKIGIAGACRRIGTTTSAIQCIKYLQLKGHNACYIEVNGSGFVEQHNQYFHTSHDGYLGKVTFENVDMYYKQEHLPEVLKSDYDYYVYDFGTYTESSFNKTSFLEKDIRIFVLGSKASEMKQTMEVLRNEYYTDVSYVFNFISERERPDLLEFMEEKAAVTYFTVYTPDQFEYVHNPFWEKMLPVEDVNMADRRKKRTGFFRWRRKRSTEEKGEKTDGCT